MAIDFPSSPTVGQTYGFGGINYVFTAQGVWSITSTGAPATSTSAITMQTFTADGTYVPTAGTQFAIVETVGGGGGGGSALWTSVDLQYFGAGGGGSGGYSRSVLTAAQIGTSQTITIGAGGAGGVVTATPSNGSSGTDTSFGSLVIAKGGSGGGYSSPTSDGSLGAQQGVGGAGGVSGTGDIVAAGSPGGGGFYVNPASSGVIGNCGEGGSSIFGGGGVAVTGVGTGGSFDGSPGRNYGSGGGGGYVAPGGDGISFGGAGSAGIVIVTEYNITAAGPQGPVGPAGGTTGVAQPQGRLTLQTVTPVMTTTQSAKATIFYTPYIGDRVSLWDGSVWTMTTFAELSNVTTASSVNNAGPAAVAANSVYDLFVWSNAGTIRLTRGPAWTNATTRSAGTALVRQNGIWLNNAAITNGPAASRGTYVGTVRSNGSSQIDWIIGGSGAGGVAALLNVWNCYNRVEVATTVTDSTASWSPSVSATFAALNGSNNNRVSVVSGLAEEGVYVDLIITIQCNVGSTGYVGVALDSAVAADKKVVFSQGTGSGAIQNSIAAASSYSPQLGFHFWQAVSAGDGSTAFTLYGGTSEGLTVQTRM